MLAVLTACSFEHGQALRDASPQDARADSVDAPSDGPSRVRTNLIALYSFDENSGTVVTDTANAGAPVNLTIADQSKVAWTASELTINQPVPIASPQSVPNRITIDCKATNEMTLEAWVTSAKLDQTGAAGQFARVVTMSVNAGSRNFAIGQLGTEWAMQARTSNPTTDGQGSPILSGQTVSASATQIMLTVNTTERALYVNGQLVASDALGGTLGIWMNGHRLAFGAEPTANNPWNGTLHLVAFYNRVLTTAEIANNYTLGANAR